MSLTITTPAPGVTQLTMRSWAGALSGYDVRAYLVHGVLVDTGFAHAGGALLRALDALQPRGAVITHWHEDHAGNAARLAARGVPLLMHEHCEATLRARPPIAAYRRVVWGRSARLTTPLTPFDPAPLQVIHLPGHTRDHLVVWDAERRLLVSGDLFLGVKVRVAHHEESPRRLAASLERAASLEPLLLLDAHRGPLPNAASLLRAKAAWLRETIGAVTALHARGVDVAEIARRVLGAEPLVGVLSGGEYSKRAFVEATLTDVEAQNLS